MGKALASMRGKIKRSPKSDALFTLHPPHPTFPPVSMLSLSLLALRVVLAIVWLGGKATASIHPIAVDGNKFIDTVTRMPFLIKGLDYQPGGSSGVSDASDPLSNATICTRDIILFQELGINTIRVYSVNPDLNHDVCMTLLALAGIYVVLDVNSPLENQHLNRYEPWTSYNDLYLGHVLRVVDQFSFYNNTLGFFAGNEIINDRKSAKEAPVYTKAVIRDIKTYIAYNAPRPIPVGYSAADDLKYRTLLSRYLECTENDPLASVDFYGVNTYQWCGQQTFYTSGYNLLVDDYARFTKPVFFSEFGCNEISPRLFEEVASIFLDDMVGVFSGGLVYEYSQEANNYGLVEIDATGNIRLLRDFEALRSQFELVEGRPFPKEASTKTHRKEPYCETSYPNIDISKGVPASLAEDYNVDGVQVKRGQYVDIQEAALYTLFQIYYTDGSLYPPDIGIEVIRDLSSVDYAVSESPPVRPPRLIRSFFRNGASTVTLTLAHAVIGLVALVASVAA